MQFLFLLIVFWVSSQWFLRTFFIAVSSRLNRFAINKIEQEVKLQNHAEKALFQKPTKCKFQQIP